MFFAFHREVYTWLNLNPLTIDCARRKILCMVYCTMKYSTKEMKKEQIIGPYQFEVIWVVTLIDKRKAFFS